MEYGRWAPRYDEIREEFGFPFENEDSSARRLADLLPEGARTDALGRLARRLHGREAVVVGLAPDWGAPPVWRRSADAPPPALVVADGATSVCLDAGLIPDVVVTDLDGPVPAEVLANARGALVVVHAHGDNRSALETWVPEFSGELVGSWAGPPRDGLLDVGGFTDGDRAVYLAEHVGATRLLLWGFEFDRSDEMDEGSRTRKLRKLAWAARLIGDLVQTSPVPIDEWSRDGTVRPYVPPGVGNATQ